MIGITDVRNWETLGMKQTDGQTDHCVMQHNPWNRKREGRSLTSSLSKLAKWRSSREWFQLRNASIGALNWAHFTEWYRDRRTFFLYTLCLVASFLAQKHHQTSIKSTHDTLNTRVSEIMFSYIDNCPTRCNTKQSIYYSASSFYMFRVSTTPIIRSTQNCNYSLWYCAATSLQRGHAWSRWSEVAAQKYGQYRRL